MSVSPTRSGTVIAVRYQLKHTRPVAEPQLRVLGGEPRQAGVVEVDALGVRHDVVRAVGDVARARGVDSGPTSTKPISSTLASL